MFNHLNDRKYKICDALTSENIDDLYIYLTSQIKDPNIWLQDHEYNAQHNLIPQEILPNCSEIERMMATDVVGYPLDDILTKVDRAAMSVSLETRIPFLDHKLVEFAGTLPESMKIRNGQNKWLLRNLIPARSRKIGK